MFTRIVLVVGILSGCVFAQDCQRTIFAGRVKGLEAFRQSLGGGLVFHLDPWKNNLGWTIAISPKESNDDWAYPVNPPLRSRNSQYMATGYGDAVKDVLKYRHEVYFLLTEANYREISKLVGEALWPYTSKEPEKTAERYFEALNAVKTGTVIVKAVDYDKDGPPETVDWMQFQTVVIVPLGFEGDIGLSWTTGICKSMLEAARKP
jgi:hypothetical protein